MGSTTASAAETDETPDADELPADLGFSASLHVPPGLGVRTLADEIAGNVARALASRLVVTPRPWRTGETTTPDGHTCRSRLLRRGEDRWWQVQVTSSSGHRVHIDVAHLGESELLVQARVNVDGALSYGDPAMHAWVDARSEVSDVALGRHLRFSSGQALLELGADGGDAAVSAARPHAAPVLVLASDLIEHESIDVDAELPWGDSRRPPLLALTAAPQDITDKAAGNHVAAMALREIGVAAQVMVLKPGVPGPNAVLYLPGQRPQRITPDATGDGLVLFEAFLALSHWQVENWRMPGPGWDVPALPARDQPAPVAHIDPVGSAARALAKALDRDDPGEDRAARAELLRSAALELAARADRTTALERDLAAAEHTVTRLRAIAEDLRAQTHTRAPAAPVMPPAEPAETADTGDTADLSLLPNGHVPVAPRTVADAVQIAQILCPRLTILPAAHHSASQSAYPRPSQVLADLLLINDIAEQWATGTLDRDLRSAFEARTRAYRNGISPTARREYPSDYLRTLPDGREIMLGPHISRGTGSPNKILRIYFALDEATRTFVVGHIGRKLRDRSNP